MHLFIYAFDKAERGMEGRRQGGKEVGREKEKEREKKVNLACFGSLPK